MKTIAANPTDMDAWIVLAGLIVALTLAALLVSLAALYHATRVWRRASARIEQARQEWAVSSEALGARLTRLTSDLADSPRGLLAEPLPNPAKPCMNLSRRSQALRLHRQGDSAEQIARALDVPRQQVDLLLKVHEIVLHNAAARFG